MIENTPKKNNLPLWLNDGTASLNLENIENEADVLAEKQKEMQNGQRLSVFIKSPLSDLITRSSQLLNFQTFSENHLSDLLKSVENEINNRKKAGSEVMEQLLRRVFSSSEVTVLVQTNDDNLRKLMVLRRKIKEEILSKNGKPEIKRLSPDEKLNEIEKTLLLPPVLAELVGFIRSSADKSVLANLGSAQILAFDGQAKVEEQRLLKILSGVVLIQEHPSTENSSATRLSLIQVKIRDNISGLNMLCARLPEFYRKAISTEKDPEFVLNREIELVRNELLREIDVEKLSPETQEIIKLLILAQAQTRVRLNALAADLSDPSHSSLRKPVIKPLEKNKTLSVIESLEDDDTPEDDVDDDYKFREPTKMIHDEHILSIPGEGQRLIPTGIRERIRNLVRLVRSIRLRNSLPSLLRTQPPLNHSDPEVPTKSTGQDSQEKKPSLKDKRDRENRENRESIGYNLFANKIGLPGYDQALPAWLKKTELIEYLQDSFPNDAGLNQISNLPLAEIDNAITLVASRLQIPEKVAKILIANILEKKD